MPAFAVDKGTGSLEYISVKGRARFKKIQIGLIILSFFLSTTAARTQHEKMLIAAASDLKFALDSVIVVFKKAHSGVEVNVTYGSSGKLYEQISHSAPFDLFFSADIDYPLNLKKKGVAVSEVMNYGVGRIVIWTQLTDPAMGINSLFDKNITKVAIANPKHAPYGRRAEEALKHYGVYDRLKPKLVFGENISQTAQFITVGAADAGIIALSLARSPYMRNLRGRYYLIPEAAHQKLEQGFVVLKHAQKNGPAWAFAEFMQSKEAVDILLFFGFSADVN